MKKQKGNIVDKSFFNENFPINYDEISGRCEEEKRGIAIYYVLIGTIFLEVLPEIEKIIKEERKSFIIFPKAISDEERKNVLDALCFFPLIDMIPIIYEICNNENKAKKIEYTLMGYFNPEFHEEIYKMGKLRESEGLFVFNRSIRKIGEAVGIVNPFMDLNIMEYTNMLIIIGVHTVRLFCECDEKRIILSMITSLRHLR